MHCRRAVVLSGGGIKGAWQAGVLYRLLAEEGISYSIFCGVSVGALNASFLAQYPTEESCKSGSDLYDFWVGLEPASVYRRWFPFGRLHALWKSSVYDSRPLQKMVRSTLDPDKILTSRNSLRVGAVSLTTGRYRIFKEDYEDLPGAVLASSAFPAMFTPIELEGEIWGDGGVKEITPLKSAIELGATHIDVILCSPEENTVRFPKKPKAMDTAFRAIDLMSDEILSKDIDKALLINRMIASGSGKPWERNIHLRIYRPKRTLTENNLDFNRNGILSMLDQGYIDGETFTVALQ